MVRHAVRNVPYYADKYRGIDPDRFDLADLPPTNKVELMADFDRTVSDRAITRERLEAFVDHPEHSDRLFLGRYIAGHTSGSQGQPMFLVQDRRHVELFYGLQMTRGNNERATPLQALTRLFRRRRLAVVTLRKGFYPSAVMFQHMPAAARRYVDMLWLSQTDPDLVDRLNAFRPDALAAYACVLEQLAIEAEAGRLDLAPGLKQVVSNSELLTTRAQARIESAFGLHVMNNYATGEVPFLSNGCPTDDGAHVNADWAILEVVDSNYRPVPPGVPGEKVLLTNLANALQPILRYEVGDVVTMADEPCRCGSRLPRIASIGGRAADVFWVGEGSRRRRLINLFLGHAMEFDPGLREWQAIQVERDRIEIRLEALPGARLDLARLGRVLDDELKTYGFGEIEVDFRVVPRLDPHPQTGKFERMISLVDAKSPRDRTHPAASLESVGGR
jgi:phenylacetate-coenzyme A ligase PaaK-like adenylate-forming protein